MFSEESSSFDSQQNQQNSSEFPNGVRGVNIQRALNQLEEMILTSVRIPFTRRTIVDEDQLLEQLDLVRQSIPEAFQEAQAILQQKDEIIRQGEEYAEDIIKSAEAKASQILKETDIMQQAQQQAKHLREQVEQECDALQEQTVAEIEQRRQRAKQELDQMRQRAIREAEEIQQGADEYADSVLGSIEQQLSDMLQIIRNGRQQLED